ncbi:MAG: type 1 glutamine amidotransferase [Phycisphaerales bacterium]|jgi:GMP synthase-like glutamine amidotransferase|nr:type 1 glutamine amidotransferase [Phycisphaerales bacterium]
MALLIIEHSERTGSDRLGMKLRDDGHKLKIVRVHLGEQLPTSLHGIDGIVTCGGPQPPDCEEPWVEPELALLKAADEAELPILGICLGCQLLARALGGTLSHLDEPELGWFDITYTPLGREHPLFAGQPWTGPQFHWHHWQVETLPENAKLIASSDRCKNQAWMRGVNTFAIQFHPECERSTITDWIADDSRTLHEYSIDAQTIEQESDAQFEDYIRLTDRFFEAVSQLLMPMGARFSRQKV